MGYEAPRLALSRRGFALASLSAAGGLALGIRPTGAADGSEVGPWVVIDPDATVTIRVARSELGRGIWTALSMMGAEDLTCDWSNVGAEYASAHRNLKDHVQGRVATGGSNSVRLTHPLLQQAGASAGVRLIGAAAKRWRVPQSRCVAQNGAVLHPPTDRRLTYGALARDAASIVPAQAPAIKRPGEFRLCGTGVHRLDSRAKSTGQAQFGIDVRVPGMLYAALTLSPVIGGAMKSYRAENVMHRPGVHAVVPVPGGVARVADRFWRAKQAAAALDVTWDDGPGAGTSSEQFRTEYRAALDGPMITARSDGDARAALGSTVIDAVYEVPCLAHAPMGPLNCTAYVQPDRVDVWLGTQAPETATRLAAHAAGVPADNVYVHNCFLGGGFGRRSMNDDLVSAVTVSRAVGKPVKLIWTHETDMQHTRYRPMAALRCRGSLEALHIQTAVGSILGSLGRHRGGGLEPTAVSGLVDQAYAARNMPIEAALKNTQIPVMFRRSVGYSQNTIVLESFIDELAHEAGEDRYRFRRKLLAGQPAWLRVLDTAAEKAGWHTNLPKGKGRGMAVHISHDTIVAELAIGSAGQPRVERVVAVADPGSVINPRLIEMQFEGAIIYGLTAARYDAITLKDGRVEQSNFDTDPMMGMQDAPRIEASIVPSRGRRWSAEPDRYAAAIGDAAASARIHTAVS